MELIGLSYFDVMLLVAIIAFCDVISAITGMAGGVIALSAMNIFMPLNIAIPIHASIQVCNNTTRIILLKKNLLKSMCIPFSVGVVLGAGAMSYIVIKYVIGQSIPLFLLTVLVAYTIFKPKKLPDIKIKHHNFFWVGIATGAVGILAGAVDPLLGAFFFRDDLTKEQVVANKSFMQLMTHLTKIPAFIIIGFAFADYIWLILILSTVAVLATKFGIKYLEKINQSVFRKLMWWALLFAFVRLIYSLVITI